MGLKTELWKLLRLTVFERDNNTCVYCGRKRKSVKYLTVDHVVPVCRGGQDVLDNLVTACKPCNLHKGSRTPKEAGMCIQDWSKYE